ncbi:MAG: YdjY domain-containing protein [Vicinamibacterales bacterium]
MNRTLLHSTVCLAMFASAGPTVDGQTQSAGTPAGQAGAPPTPPVYVERKPPTTPSRVEKLSATSLRIGAVSVDMTRKEVSVKGTVNDPAQLEFIVNTKGGYKSYESAIEAECSAIDFNLGLVLIGLDRDRATARPRFHFDPVPPQGDQVEVWISWKAGTEVKRVRGEELVYDEGSKKVLTASRWVYTGSQFFPGSRAFLADVDGVLIGFVHTPAPLIERADPVPGSFGSVKVNPALGLVPGTPVTVIVRAVAPAGH